jgi:hypothetical protein
MPSNRLSIAGLLPLLLLSSDGLFSSAFRPAPLLNRFDRGGQSWENL